MLEVLFEASVGVREASRTARVHRDTAMRYRRKWLERQLQQAYDYMWDHECDKCDAVTWFLPRKDVNAMFDDWESDQHGKVPKSKWH